MTSIVTVSSPKLEAKQPFSLDLEKMVRVYETCVKVREIAKRQLLLSDDMALIAINAEIAAAKSTLNQEAFMILANETGKIARQMSAHVAQVLADANALAKDALVGVVKTRRLAKFNQGMPRVQQPQNVELVQGISRGLQAELSTLLAGILKSQEGIETGRQVLAKHSQRVSRITTYFRIEASRDAEHGEYFRNIADDLNTLITEAQAISQELHEVLAAHVY